MGENCGRSVKLFWSLRLPALVQFAGCGGVLVENWLMWLREGWIGGLSPHVDTALARLVDFRQPGSVTISRYVQDGGKPQISSPLVELRQGWIGDRIPRVGTALSRLVDLRRKAQESMTISLHLQDG